MEADSEPQLPADTLMLLEQFHAEKDARKTQFEKLQTEAENAFRDGDGELSMDIFGEDWNASQFWYTDDTARILARQLLANTDETTAIAIVSAPSVYVALRNLINVERDGNKPRVVLMEYDRRFEVVGSDFVPYDFQKPLQLPPELRGQFDRIICDPPFLSEDCQTKTALTVRALARDWSAPSETSRGVRFISCTGERMEATILRLYGKIGAQTTTFEPQHSNGLGNEFRCYANFESDAWAWRCG